MPTSPEDPAALSLPASGISPVAAPNPPTTTALSRSAAASLSRRLRAMASQLSAAPSAPVAPPSVFSSTPQAPPDAILGLNAAFLACTAPSKVNLGVGAYRTATGAPLVLSVVKRVEAALAADPSHTHEYLPQTGLASFAELAPRLLFGEDCPALDDGRVVSVQALSGTGALRVAFEFLRKFGGGPGKVLLPQPTWANHKNVVADAQLELGWYRYFDEGTGGVDVDGMIEDLENAEPGTVVLLHACAHNPTGADPSPEAWRRILSTVQSRSLLPLFDNAYQGFASGDLHADAAAVRLFVRAGIDVLACQSFAKNAGLYGERVGAFSVVLSSSTADVPSVKAAVRSQLARIVRGLYSSPPKHGAAVMAAVLGDPALFKEWQDELRGMAERIRLMRVLLKKELEDCGAPGDWSRIVNQIGMFSYTGLSAAQVNWMREKHHVYMTANGRMSMAGLNEGNVRYVAEAVKDALLNVVKQD